MVLVGFRGSERDSYDCTVRSMRYERTRIDSLAVLYTAGRRVKCDKKGRMVGRSESGGESTPLNARTQSRLTVSAVPLWETLPSASGSPATPPAKTSRVHACSPVAPLCATCTHNLIDLQPETRVLGWCTRRLSAPCLSRISGAITGAHTSGP